MSEQIYDYKIVSTTLETLWNWLQSKYKFERDVIKGEILFASLDGKKYEVMEDKHLDALTVEAAFLGLKGVEKKKIKMLLNSHLVEEKNFIHQYFKRIKEVPCKDAIKKLAACITTTKPELFLKYLTKWLTACVANVMIKEGCQNHMCLVLTGGQGKGKTTFYQYLIPPELRSYMFTGELDLMKKSECSWKMVEYWLINIEEQIKALNRADANTMKGLITMPDVKGRKPYGMMDSRGTRIGNFMASTNDEEFLNDPTGSRRYLSFKVIDINQKGYQAINIDSVWSNAYQLFQDKNFEYWITASEITELEDNNKAFIDISQEHELVDIFFEAVKSKQDATHAVPTTYIHSFLSAETNNKNLSSYRIGKALAAMGFVKDNYRGNGDLYATKNWFLKLRKPTEKAGVIQQFQITF
jgi:predicted P-loop ATPase